MAAGNRKSTVTRSAWAIQRERCPYLDERPPAPERVKPMADLLQNVCRKAGLSERLWQQSLITDWESLVGKTVAAHTRPGELQHSTLVIYVDSSPWLSELQRTFARRILASLQERYDSRRIRTLRWRLDPGS
jgi:predicted nucleic acid-binding Zn ribbon protein